MRPAARVAAAIEILDLILDGEPAEKALTNWARRSRFAGSGDRAAIRDHVFGALRCRRSYAWAGGSETGRGLMIGAMRVAGADLGEVFTGEGHAPAALADDENVVSEAAPRAVAADIPDWVMPEVERSLGDAFEDVTRALQHRAPVFLRANLALTTREAAIAALGAEEITCQTHELAQTAIEVTGNARRVGNSETFRDGLVELQDAASQAVVAQLPKAARVLDFCAGGGGKSLALAAMGSEVFAHDAIAERMKDLPARAERAETPITCVTFSEAERAAPYDLVLCDVPCSGSGAWRRAPDGKWRLTAEMLEKTKKIQMDILAQASELVSAEGTLAYITCSILASENQEQVDAFCALNPVWKIAKSLSFSPVDGGDGFFVATLKRQIV